MGIPSIVAWLCCAVLRCSHAGSVAATKLSTHVHGSVYLQYSRTHVHMCSRAHVPHRARRSRCGTASRRAGTRGTQTPARPTSRARGRAAPAGSCTADGWSTRVHWVLKHTHKHAPCCSTERALMPAGTGAGGTDAILTYLLTGGLVLPLPHFHSSS